MREIKFRVWDMQTRSFHYFGIKNNISELVEDGCFGEGYILKNTEQYTGLKDNNGKEIYEGDIILYVWLHYLYSAVVKWDQERCRFYYSDKNFNNGEYLKIIGNIHENPELLK